MSLISSFEKVGSSIDPKIRNNLAEGMPRRIASWPLTFLPKSWKVLGTPCLRGIGSVCWCTVLHEQESGHVP